MARRIAAPWATANRIWTVIRDREVTFLAAAVAYYAFVSLLPSVVLALVLATTFGGDRLAADVVAATDDLLSAQGQELFRAALRNDVGRGSATVVSLPLAAWGTLKVFRGLDRAFSRVYGVKGTPSLSAQLRNATVVAGSIGLGFVLTVGLGAAVAALRLPAGVRLLGVLILPGVLSAAFLPMYVVFPGTEVALRDAVPGAVLAAVGWTVLQAGFQVYVGLVGGSNARLFGAIGGVLLLITWLYLASLLLLAGAVVNVSLAGEVAPDRHGQEPPDRPPRRMSDDRDDAVDDTNGPNDRDDAGAPDVAALERRVNRLQQQLDELDERTVEKPDLESELRRYVRQRMRRGHARGWGPYLVLLYGTILVLGAFVYLDGLVAIAAMIVLFLSTLGLYTLFVLVGLGLNALEYPGRLLDIAREYRRGD